jgi:hypothetical protein
MFLEEKRKSRRVEGREYAILETGAECREIVAK